MTGIQTEPVLRWTSASGRLYTVESAGTITGFFNDISGALPATPPLNTFTGSPAAARYYRVRALSF